MTMPGRKFSQANSSYRYGFGGQEKSDEVKGEGNSYTAEFWEYDPRLMRRWNVDPIDKEYESPYAAFGNNPIWNIDPTGADTAKYLSGTQILDAIKIGFTVINNDIKNKKYNIGNDRTKELQTAIDAYADQHQDISFGAYAEFRETVFDYFGGLNEIAFASTTAWSRLSNQLNNSELNTKTQIAGVIARIQTYNGFGLGVITAGANVGLGLAAGAVGTKAGPGPRAPFKSNVQIPLSTGPKVSYNGNQVPVYRGANGNDPLFQLKTGEYKYTENSIRGLSLHVDAPKLTNVRGASYQITQMPKGLKIVQQGKDPGHFEIVPASKLSQEQFQNLLNQVKYTKVSN
jgi:RHS repeat-associated protein